MITLIIINLVLLVFNFFLTIINSLVLVKTRIKIDNLTDIDLLKDVSLDELAVKISSHLINKN